MDVTPFIEDKLRIMQIYQGELAKFPFPRSIDALAKALHPGQDIRIENFRDTRLPEDRIDAVVGSGIEHGSMVAVRIIAVGKVKRMRSDNGDNVGYRLHKMSLGYRVEQSGRPCQAVSTCKTVSRRHFLDFAVKSR